MGQKDLFELIFRMILNYIEIVTKYEVFTCLNSFGLHSVVCKLLAFDRNTWNHIVVSKLFTIRRVNWNYNCFQMIIMGWVWLIGLVGRVFANGPGNLASIPGRVIPKILKMVLDISLLNTQQYKVHIKGKVEQSWERSSTLPYTSV